MSIFELFRATTRTHVQALTYGMLVLERQPSAVEQLEVCARAARSLRAAARIAGLHAGADLAHAMEDCFAAARRGAIELGPEQIGVMLEGVDLLEQLAKAPRGTAKRKRVLIVDDSLAVRELGRSLLSRRGYDVEVTVDGLDGWNALRVGTFDLVITDIDMPLVDGITLLELIRENGRFERLPVLIACGADRDQDWEHGLRAGADYYVAKDSLHDTLVQAVAALIGAAQR